jgi:hypothetical protein
MSPCGQYIAVMTNSTEVLQFSSQTGGTSDSGILFGLAAARLRLFEFWRCNGDQCRSPADVCIVGNHPTRYHPFWFDRCYDQLLSLALSKNNYNVRWTSEFLVRGRDHYWSVNSSVLCLTLIVAHRCALSVRGGSFSTKIARSHHVRSTPDSDRRADVPFGSFVPTAKVSRLARSPRRPRRCKTA